MWKSSGFFTLLWRSAKVYLFWGQNNIYLGFRNNWSHYSPFPVILFPINLTKKVMRWEQTQQMKQFPCKMSRGRSDWPGLMRAGSRVSIRLVAMITLTSPRESKPSSWLSSSSMVLWISLSPPEFESYLHNADRKQGFNLIRPPVLILQPSCTKLSAIFTM